MIETACLSRAELVELTGRQHADSQAAWLVARWDEIEKLFLEEVGLGWTKARSAPRTYDLMCEVLRPWRPRVAS